ncbi:MAG: DUF2064 domain-containing protein [Candidatus Eisenbacteria bacterium]|nr:DUF2064 domain-containing protein [Candidatus Eisenbacteria bacterium]
MERAGPAAARSERVRAQERPRLIIFTRHPEAGGVKTRLVPYLGPDGARHIHDWLTRRIARAARRLRRLEHVAVEIHHAGGTREEMRRWLGPDLAYRRQIRGDLGRRMAAAFEEAFAAGAPSAAIVGSDVPGVTAGLLQDAFHRLERRRLVVGPARDGGYYFIGLRRPAPELFSGIAWGTAAALDQTHRAAKRAGISMEALEMLPDVDRPEDIAHALRLGWRPPGR